MASYYLVTELPPLDGNNNSSANSINNSGTVAGSSGYETKRATIWSGGTFAAPPKANALPFIEGDSNEALAINDWGQIVGTDGDQSHSQAVIWADFDQDWVYPTKHGYSVALDISNNGWIAGYGNDNDHNKAYLWRYLYEEYRLGASSSKANAKVNAVNNHNLSAGTIADKAIVWAWDYYTQHPTQHQLNGGNHSSVANDINDNGEIVGSVSNVSDKQRPVKWKNFVSNPDFLDTSFPINSGEAIAINNNGDIVGWYAPMQNENERRAFLSNSTTFIQYRIGPNGIPIPPTVAPTMIDLNLLIDPGSGWHLKFAKDINDKGQITGIGTLNGAERGFRLDPVYQILPHEFPMDLPHMITTEVFKILTGLIGGNDGWILTPNGVVRVPGNRPDRSMLSLLDMRIQMMIQNLLALANNDHSSYESRKRMVEKIEKFILTLHDQLKR